MYSRFFGDHARKYIPGNPGITYQHMPGGGGVKAGNFLCNVAQNIKFELDRFNWLGTVGRSYYLIGIWHKAPPEVVEDVRNAIGMK